MRAKSQAIPKLLAVLTLLVTAVLSSLSQASATPSAFAQTDTPRLIDVIEVSGLIDPVVAEFVVNSMARARANDAEVIVIQLDSPGSVLSDAELDDLTGQLTRSVVPVTVWIGPSGSVARGDAARLAAAAAVTGRASKTELTGATAALNSPTLGDFVVALDGRQAGDRTLVTARSAGRGRQTAAGNVRFSKLSLVQQLMHTAANPQVAYLLLMIGLLLVVFEFFTAGVGVAAGVGAVALVLAAFGLSDLPTSPLGLALLIVAMVAFSIDLQAGAPRVWTAVALVAMVIGSWRLFGPPVGLPVVTIALVSGGIALAMISGMTAMLRARFATPTIGKESMVGEMVDAVTDVNPDGMVLLGGATWRARTNRATPINAGDRARVVAIDGLLLEVEPEEGGARDAHH